MTRCRGLPAGSVMAGQPNQKSIHAFKHVKLIYQPHALRVCCPYIERIRRFRKSLSLPYTPPGTIQSFRSSLAMRWQGQQGSNPRPAVLETAALPTELYPYASGRIGLLEASTRYVKPESCSVPLLSVRRDRGDLRKRQRRATGAPLLSVGPAHGRADQSLIDATMPAPTVRPPSRMAKRSFSSIAIGTISSTSTVTLSPGITISVPDGSVTMPVTSVVRK